MNVEQSSNSSQEVTCDVEGPNDEVSCFRLSSKQDTFFVCRPQIDDLPFREVSAKSLPEALKYLRCLYLEHRNVARDFQTFLREGLGCVWYKGVKIRPSYLIQKSDELGLLKLPYTVTISKGPDGSQTWTLTAGHKSGLLPGEEIVDTFLVEACSREEAEGMRDRTMLAYDLEKNFDIH